MEGHGNCVKRAKFTTIVGGSVQELPIVHGVRLFNDILDFSMSVLLRGIKNQGQNAMTMTLARKGSS